MFKILVVEDDRNLRKLMKAILTNGGYTTFTAENGAEALEVLDQEHIDLIVLDIMMPEMDGYTLTKELRDSDIMIPILMVTSKSLPQDKKYGFIVGTDDYMTKPVDDEEMLFRIKALLRRSKFANEKKMSIGETVLEYDTLTVIEEGVQHTLPPKEFYLLYKLLSYPGQTFTKLQLLDEIWGRDSESDEVTVSVHINRLRKRFENNRDFEIVTARGVGYKAVKV
ncbi:response regulator transcription factor [Bacillus sp. BGMRC 2118]|nr:response regulator transcription factor [Bacillus sp. BGMRC 2118]